MTIDSSSQFLCKRMLNLTLSFPNAVNFPHFQVICYLSLYCSFVFYSSNPICAYWGVDKSLVRQGRQQARKYVRDARDFNNIDTRTVKFLSPSQSKAQKKIRNFLTETLVFFLPGRAKDLSAPLYSSFICSYDAPFRIGTREASRVSSIL